MRIGRHIYVKQDALGIILLILHMQQICQGWGEDV
jgi:hypothetical protein